MAKGYYGARKNVWTVAKNAVEKGLQYAYVGRKLRKRQFRSLWIQRINAGARQHGMSYSAFMGQLSKSGIELNRKVLADLAMKPFVKFINGAASFITFLGKRTGVPFYGLLRMIQ